LQALLLRTDRIPDRKIQSRHYLLRLLGGPLGEDSNEIITVVMQVKGSFTRTYNKSSVPLPYATASMSKKRRKRQTAEDEDVIGPNDDDRADAAAVDSSPSDDDDIAADSMIKVTFRIFFFIASIGRAVVFLANGYEKRSVTCHMESDGVICHLIVKLTTP